MATTSYLEAVSGGMVAAAAFSDDDAAVQAVTLLRDSGVREQDVCVLARDRERAELVAGGRAWLPGKDWNGLRYRIRRLLPGGIIPRDVRKRYGQALSEGKIVVVAAAGGQPPDTIAALFEQARGESVEQWWQQPTYLFAPPELAGPFQPGTAPVTASEALTRAARAWGITLGAQYRDVYPDNLVYRCTLSDGTPAVIKTEPDRASEDEFLGGIEALVLYDGHGMARVLKVDRAERVVLMELVEPGEPLWEAPIDLALEAAASVMARLRREPPARHAFPNVRDYERAWPNHVRLHGGTGPVDADLFEMSERLFHELCDSSAAPVVLHGDLHYGNVLSSHRDRWLAIDPKGVIGEACYEVGDLFRNRIDELYATSDPARAMRRRIELLADLAGFDRERIRRWSLAQAVLSEIWTADDPAKASHVDMRAARLLHAIGRLDG